jgi:hypothetical protein
MRDEERHMHTNCCLGQRDVPWWPAHALVQTSTPIQRRRRC